MEDGHFDKYPRGVGIEFHADILGILITLVVLGVGLIVAVYSKLPVQRKLRIKNLFFILFFLLQVTGLAGICLTGDAFNLYVLIEVAALTGYGLIAMGSKRAAAATFNYVILGTIGASFTFWVLDMYTLKPELLNMVGIHDVIEANGLADSATMQVAFVLVGVGILDKDGILSVSCLAAQCIL